MNFHTFVDYLFLGIIQNEIRIEATLYFVTFRAFAHTERSKTFGAISENRMFTACKFPRLV